MYGGEERVRSSQGCSSGPLGCELKHLHIPLCAFGDRKTLTHRLLRVHVSVGGRLLHTVFHRHTNASTWACVDTSQHNNTKKTLYRERLEELKLLSLSRKLRGVLILVCKCHQKEKLLSTKGLFNVRERQNKTRQLKAAKAGLKSRRAR